MHLLISPCTDSAIEQPKLSPRYCGLWIIIKRIRKVAYNKLDLLARSHIQPVFYVSRLKNYLLDEDSMVDGAVELQNPLVVDSGLDRILETRI